MSDDDINDDKLSELYRHGASETPAARINQRILQASKQHAHSTDRKQSGFEWLIAHLSSSRSLAFAAVMVICISIILQIQFDYPDSMHPEEISDISPLANDVMPDHEQLLKEEITTLESTEIKQSSKPAPRSAAPAISRQPAVSTAEKQKSISGKKELQRASKQKEAERIRALKKRQQSQRERMTAPIESTTMMADSLISPMTLITQQDCEELTHAACLASTQCILSTSTDDLVCRNARNICEQGFIQAENLEQLCVKNQACQFIAGHCHCDDKGSCQCENNQPPACQLIK